MENQMNMTLDPLRPRQNLLLLAGDNFESIYQIKIAVIWFKFHGNLFPMKNNSALVQIMTWCRWLSSVTHKWVNRFQWLTYWGIKQDRCICPIKNVSLMYLMVKRWIFVWVRSGQTKYLVKIPQMGGAWTLTMPMVRATVLVQSPHGKFAGNFRVHH